MNLCFPLIKFWTRQYRIDIYLVKSIFYLSPNLTAPPFRRDATDDLSASSGLTSLLLAALLP